LRAVRSVLRDEKKLSIAASRSAHRADDAMVGHEPLELLAGVLAAAIGVMQ
jgi:hypothetical protein